MAIGGTSAIKEEFPAWIDKDVAPIRTWVDAHAADGEESAAARTLLNGIAAHWQSSFERLGLAETALD